jgi:hypothetical protein
MNRGVWVLTQIYSCLLRLYPRAYREAYGEELCTVFRLAVDEAAEQGTFSILRLGLHELRDLPGAIWREHRRERNRQKMAPATSRPFTIQPVSWRGTFAGMAPFLIFGLILIFLEIPHDWAIPPWLTYLGGAFFLGVIVLPPIGLGIGWVKGFPRWSYPYVGHVLLFSLYLMSASTPGLRIFGYDLFGRELWGWRAWIPFLTMAAIVLLITRSLRPVLKLFTNVWQDWTLLTFTMFGFMPLLVAIGFDEVDRLYSLPFMVILALVMLSTALTYLRSVYPWRRILALLVGIILIVAVTTVAPTLYWLENGWVNVKGSVVTGLVVVAIMFSPLLVGLLRRFVNFL